MPYLMFTVWQNDVFGCMMESSVLHKTHFHSLLQLPLLCTSIGLCVAIYEEGFPHKRSLCMIDDGCMIWFSYNTSRIYWTSTDKTYDFIPDEFVLDSPHKTQ